MKNYYNILGVSENASDIAIAEAYKKLAIKFHPDKNGGDLFFAERFKLVNEAYQVLAKKDEKKDYDEMLMNYSDAYEILKLQQHNEHLNRSVNRKRISSHKKSNFSWWMMGCVALSCAGILFWLNNSDRKGLNRETVYNYQEELSPEVVKVDINSRQPKGVNFATVTDHSNKKHIIIPSPINVVESKKSASIKAKKHNLALKGRKLQSIEIDKIISELQTKNSNKGVRVTQSINSNIQKDFAIVSILQKNGFTIAGRNYTTQNLSGIQINETGDYLNLIIGKIANK